jgi:hypothetical protein
LKERLATQTVSLNEADRRAEMAAAQAREAARNRERAARHERPPTCYEITLGIADIPGLPAPAAPPTPPVAQASESPAAETEEAEARIPQNDPVLRESERILADYVAMLSRPASVAVAAP